MADPDASLLPVLARKLRSLRRLPLAVVMLAAVAWWLLWPARLLITTVPSSGLARVYGRDFGTASFVPLPTPAELLRAERLRRAISLAVRYSPRSANCYPQALVAHLLLWASSVPHALFFGLARDADTGAMQAHAWVMAGPVAVSGRDSFDRYTVVRAFSSVQALAS